MVGPALRNLGENGAPSVTAEGVGNARVALFFRTVRGAPTDELEELFQFVVEEAHIAGPEGSQQRAQVLADLVVMIVQTRDVHGGKGERDLFRVLLARLHSRLPATSEALLHVCYTRGYGSYNDLVQLVEHFDASADGVLHPLRSRAKKLFVDALRRDKTALESTRGDSMAATTTTRSETSLSLAGKWAPREGRRHSKLALEFANSLFPEAADARRQYRRLVAELNRRLNTVEVSMCSGVYDEIEPTAVPARCLKLNKSAFLNMPKGPGRGNKRPHRSKDDERRIKCARAFQAASEAAVKNPLDKRKRMHGARLHPHELVREYLQGSVKKNDITEAQWVDLREEVRNSLSDNGMGLMVPLVDVSGSMSGTPMEVAVALGLLVSELTHPAFRDRMLTFESTPQWHDLPPSKSSTLFERVESAKYAPWGGSTNFAAAMELVLHTCVEWKMAADKVAQVKLVVFSDMQFDDAGALYLDRSEGSESSECSNDGSEDGNVPSDDRCWDTHYERLCGIFKSAGYHTVPTVIFWNLRGDTANYPADAHTPGVALLSGYSPSMFKLFCEGDTETILEDAKQASLPPEDRANAYQVLRKALDDERYHPVRELCAEIGEAELAGYVPPPVLDWSLLTLENGHQDVGGQPSS